MYILDTNICIYIINNNPTYIKEKFKGFSLNDLSISSITAAELAFGAEKSNSQQNKKALEKFLMPLNILPFDETVIWTYAKIRANLNKKVDSMDILIAAHAISNNWILVTNNIKEFKRIKGLRLENWIKPTKNH